MLKSLGWFIENVVVKKATQSVVGNAVDLAAPGDSGEQKLEIWIRTITSVAVTAVSGILGMGGLSIFC